MVGLSNIHETVSKMIAFVLKTNDDVNSHVLIACTKVSENDSTCIHTSVHIPNMHIYIYIGVQKFSKIAFNNFFPFLFLFLLVAGAARK